MASISLKGIELIKQFEGCRLQAYQDAVGVWTIGYGLTNACKSITGLEIKQGTKITQAQAESYLFKVLNAKYLPKITKYTNYSFNQNQIDALASFCYNIGSIDGLTKKGTRTIAQISAAIPSYNKAGGKELAGLTKRRAAEKKLFDTSTATSASTEFKVKVIASALNIRKGAGTSYAVVGSIKDKGTYTISKTSGSWGYLKSGKGWICIDSKYVTKL